MSSRTDAVRLDWTSGGKIVASAKCKLGRDGAWGYGNCEYDDKPVKAVGQIEAKLDLVLGTQGWRRFKRMRSN